MFTPDGYAKIVRLFRRMSREAADPGNDCSAPPRVLMVPLLTKWKKDAPAR